VDAVLGLADVAQGMPRLQARHEVELARIRRDDPAPVLSGTVDVYSNAQAAVFAHGLRWSPRPIFQSYQAYTGALAEMNRRHLLGPRRPDHLLVRIEPIDGRLPALEDGASWLDILERYALREEGGFAVVDRQPVPALAATRRLAEWRGEGWNELPMEGVLQIAAITVHEPARDLRSVFKRAAAHEIQLRMEDGTVRGFRFLRSRGPGTVRALAAGAEHRGLRLALRALRIWREAGACAGRAHHGTGRPRGPVYARPAARDRRCRGFPASSRSPLRALECRLQLMAGGDGLRKHPHVIEPDGRGLNAHPPATFRIAAPASAVRVCTRMARRALESGKSDGYVLALWRNGAPRPAAEERVTPQAALGGRESCVEARFDMPAADVELRIGPNGHDHWDWVYITRVDLDE
jgi:hypothetical protein